VVRAALRHFLKINISRAGNQHLQETPPQSESPLSDSAALCRGISQAAFLRTGAPCFFRPKSKPGKLLPSLEFDTIHASGNKMRGDTQPVSVIAVATIFLRRVQ